jgi:ketosteroid isomerase-like protein
MAAREDAVRAINEAFYRAFRERDLAAMEELWAARAPVACMHPGMDAIVGRDRVIESWRGILAHDGAPRLLCTAVEVHLLGDTAFVTCLEGTAGDPPALVATNVFVEEDGAWRIVCHQAGPLNTRSRHAPIEGPPDPHSVN